MLGGVSEEQAAEAAHEEQSKAQEDRDDEEEGMEGNVVEDEDGGDAYANDGVDAMDEDDEQGVRRVFDAGGGMSANLIDFFRFYIVCVRNGESPDMPYRLPFLLVPWNSWWRYLWRRATLRSCSFVSDSSLVALAAALVGTSQLLCMTSSPYVRLRSELHHEHFRLLVIHIHVEQVPRGDGDEEGLDKDGSEVVDSSRKSGKRRDKEGHREGDGLISSTLNLL